MEGEGQGQQGQQGQQGEQEAGGYVEPAVLVPGSPAAEYERELGALVTEYPDLLQPEVAQATAAQARHYAEQMGDPALAQDPAMLHAAYMAVQGAAATAPPPQAQQQGDRFDAALRVKRGASALPWG